ncbi:GNAT family N-acetyltransferase [Pseudomonas moraviensis subsp. stanleyae]|uniref:GNAT family N-acetyltransferase n=1 Tax=Pseudomonas moraviensis TaxID=321662 RepID=UPI002E354499|nr:GNAT family N-acetyltransferase [Pseudomonas moraviensis]MED7666196.1 GNAT family N-acetyltransferase [Pseudomonas moraviensis subsp. stanleyae]
MGYRIRHATDDDLAFARDLTCRNMLRYYIDHDLLWQDEAFDAGWRYREHWMILEDETPIGFFSLSQDARALYIRELQIDQAWQGQGAGSWAIDQVIEMARQARRPALRLTVFDNNPAQKLYARKGLRIVGTDECFVRMQLDLSTAVL